MIGSIGPVASERILVSRPEELDKLPDDALAEWSDVLVLSDSAWGEPEDGIAEQDEPEDVPADRPSGLHAKIIAVEQGWDVTWYVGSANLTSAAFTGNNVEMMAAVTGRKGRKGGVSGQGIDRFLEGDDGFCWRYGLENDVPPLDQTIRERFEEEFNERSDLQDELRALFDTWFYRFRQHWPDEARWRRDDAIAKLRRLLAEVCVQALEPDLVILDEFQRFKSLLEKRDEDRDPAAELAQKLFRAKAHDGKRVRTLLLSATPYKLYTADAEIGHEEHYEDFLDTTRFLLGDDNARVEELKHRLSRFGAALKFAAADKQGQFEEIRQSKRAVEAFLRNVMARTERVAASDDMDAMVTEDRHTVTPTPADVRQYLAASRPSRL